MTWNNWGNRPKDQAQILLAHWDWFDGWLFDIATYYQETDSLLINDAESKIKWERDDFYTCWCNISNPPFKLRQKIPFE